VIILFGSNATLDAGHKGRFFNGDGSKGKTSLELHDITLQNANSSDHGAEFIYAGAIMIGTGYDNPVPASLVIHDSTFATNTAYIGGAIVAFSADVEIHTSSFISNEAMQSAGAICLVQTDVKLYNCTFMSNVARGLGGGAVYLQSDTGFVVSTPIRPIPDGIQHSNITFVGCIFLGNNNTKGCNDIARYDGTSTVTFACPDGEDGEALTVHGGDVLNPADVLKCQSRASFLCNPDSKKCVTAAGGVPLSHCQVGSCAPALDPLRRYQERQALELFAEGTTSPTSDGWVHSCQQGWKDNLTDVCERYGVTCEPPSTGYVSKIDLSSCGLTGTIPSISVFTLQGLKEIHLRNEEYKGLPGLRGTLPSDLSLCSSLEVIDFNSNNLEGSVPSLAKLTNLQNIDVHYNFLGGTLPDIASPTMDYISFAGNKFTGTIPSSWSTLSNIKVLGLANNQLSGTTEIIADFPKLLVVFLRNNSFTGEIPKLPANTSVADFDHNNFSSIAADICNPNAPPAFGRPCGCSSDYPSQPFDTCCFANNNFSHDSSKQCMTNCFSEQPCSP
jgi:hypothetical protein